MFNNGRSQFEYRKHHLRSNGGHRNRNIIRHKVHLPLAVFKHQWHAKTIPMYNNDNHYYSKNPWARTRHRHWPFRQNNKQYRHRFLNVGAGENYLGGQQRKKRPFLLKKEKQFLPVFPWQEWRKLHFQRYNNSRMSSQRRQQARQAGVIAAASQVGLAWMATLVGLASMVRGPLSSVLDNIDLMQQLFNGN